MLFGSILYQHYIGWQSAILGLGGVQFSGEDTYRQQLFASRNTNRVGLLPDVQHYEHFMHYMFEGNGVETLSPQGQLATAPLKASDQDPLEHPSELLCGHRLHPGNNAKSWKVCPCCLLFLQYNYALHRIDLTWHSFKRELQTRIWWNFKRI
jgi:hypothetical protein